MTESTLNQTPQTSPPSPFDCGSCNKLVSKRYRKIICDQCCKFHHVKCALIKTSEFDLLTSSGSGWLCYSCRSEIFPLNNQSFDELLHFSNETYNDVPLLKKKV